MSINELWYLAIGLGAVGVLIGVFGILYILRSKHR